MKRSISVVVVQFHMSAASSGSRTLRRPTVGCYLELQHGPRARSSSAVREAAVDYHQGTVIPSSVCVDKERCPESLDTGLVQDTGSTPTRLSTTVLAVSSVQSSPASVSVVEGEATAKGQPHY